MIHYLSAVSLYAILTGYDQGDYSAKKLLIQKSVRVDYFPGKVNAVALVFMKNLRMSVFQYAYYDCRRTFYISRVSPHM